MPTTIDSHHHLWRLASDGFDYTWLDRPALATIRRDFLPDDLAPHLKACGIERTVVVQTQHRLAENDWALALAERHPFIAGVVGWVDLASDECERQVEAYAARPRFVGVRHVTQDEPDDDFVVGPAILRGLKALERKGVPFDLLFYIKHLRHVPTLARALPDLPMVIDHLAKPRIKDRAFGEWVDDFNAAAGFPNVFCKLSGMVTEADHARWTVDDLRPYVHAALDAFGPDRLMYGSDWPVCLLASSYERAYHALVDALGPISGPERDAIFGGTAARFYRLDV